MRGAFVGGGGSGVEEEIAAAPSRKASVFAEASGDESGDKALLAKTG